MRWIVLLGGNELNAGLVDVAAAWGARLAIVDWNAQPALRCDQHIRLDIKAAEDVSAAVGDLPGKIALAYTSADVASETAAVINSRSGLARASPDAIRRAGDKLAMNAAWREAGLLGKAYSACTSAAELADFAQKIKREVIVKPADSSSSRGVTVIEADKLPEADWEQIFSRAENASSKGCVLAEEFVYGTEYTVEMIGDASGNVEVWGVSKKYHTVNTEQNRIAVKLHYNPPDVPRDRLERLADFGAQCYRALGLTNSLGHLEVIERPSLDLVPVELAARSSGFIATHLVSVLSGAPGSYLARYRDVLAGASVQSRLVPPDRATMYFFYDPPPGTWKGEGLDLTSMLPASIRSLASSRSRLKDGASIARINTDNERYGFEVLVGDVDALTIQTVQEAEHALYARAVGPLKRGTGL